MAIQSVTLQSLMDGVADRADIAIDDFQRHTSAKVIARLNRAIRRWKMMAASAGDDTHIQIARVQTSASNTIGLDGYSPNQYITLNASDAFIRIMKIWLDSSYAIDMLPWDRMADAQIGETWAWWTNSGTGFSVFYRPIGEVSGGTGNRIQIFPKANAVYNIDVHYTPGHTDLTNPSQAFDFVMGGDEWVINDAALQTLLADGLASEGNAQAMQAWNQKLEMDLKFQLASRNARSKMDTRGHRDFLISLARGYHPVP